MVKRILLVDDSPIILAATKEALVAAGYDVDTRASVDEVVAHGVTGFDLILMDVQMPELFGDDVGMVLREERGVATPIYLLSSLSEDELRERAREAGVAGFISKQAGLEAVVAFVRRVLG
jgi:DNA-binding response OmpR family regulator